MHRPRRPTLRLIALLASVLTAVTAGAQTPAGEPRFPWLDPATTRPIVMRLEHSIAYDRATGDVRVERSRWDLDWLRLDMFGGRLTVAGRGLVTSGTMAPALGLSVGLGYVGKGFAKPGTTLEAEIRGNRIPLKVVKIPFYTEGSRR